MQNVVSLPSFFFEKVVRSIKGAFEMICAIGLLQNQWFSTQSRILIQATRLFQSFLAIQQEKLTGFLDSFDAISMLNAVLEFILSKLIFQAAYGLLVAHSRAALNSSHLDKISWKVYYYQIIMNSTDKLGKQTINSVSFNSDNTFAALATSIGFKIYSTQPFALRHERDFGTPLQFVELINKSNLIGIVGEKETPFTPPNRLAIFDDRNLIHYAGTQKIIADLNFNSKIKQVKIRQNKIVVALYNKVFLIDLFSMEIQHIIETFRFQENQIYNLISLSNDFTNSILAAPGTENGHVLLVYLSKLTERKIKAHQSSISEIIIVLSAVILTPNGQKLATTSQKGNQVRIFDTKTGAMIQQVRRGNEFATIYSICFSKEGNWLAVSSDSCNLHIFSIKPTETEKERAYSRYGESAVSNPKSWFFFLKGIIPYFDAEYSYCNHKYEEYSPEMRSWLAFGFHDDHLISISNIGYYQKVELNLKGGKCRTIEKLGQILQKEMQEKKK